VLATNCRDVVDITTVVVVGGGSVIAVDVVVAVVVDVSTKTVQPPYRTRYNIEK